MQEKWEGSIFALFKQQKSLKESLQTVRNRVLMLKQIGQRTQSSLNQTYHKIERIIGSKVQSQKKEQSKKKLQSSRARKLNEVWYHNFLNRRANETEIQNAKEQLKYWKQENASRMRKIRAHNEQYLRRRQQEEQSAREVRQKQIRSQCQRARQQKFLVEQQNLQKTRQVKDQLKNQIGQQVLQVRQQLLELNKVQQTLIKELSESSSMQRQLKERVAKVSNMHSQQVLRHFGGVEDDRKFRRLQ